MIRDVYNTNNEQALLKFNGPHRYLTSGPSFNGVKRPQIVQTTKVIKFGNVKIYGTPDKVNKINEEEAQ